MSEYYAVVREGQDDHLEHLFGFGKKGSQKKNHKYFTRVQVGSKYRYFYNPAEYAVYQAGKAAEGVASGAKSAVKAVDDKVGVSALIKKKKTGKAMKDAFHNQGKNLALAVAMAKTDPNFKPGGNLEKKLAKTLVKDKALTKKTYGEYEKAKNKYDKTLLGKISNSGVGKVAGAATYQVKRAAKGVSEKAKKGYHDLGWDVKEYKNSEKDKNGNIVKTTATLYRKRNRLAKLLGLPSLSAWNIDKDSIRVSQGKKRKDGNYSWSNRPHSRVVKKAKGTATIKKGKKVKSK